MIHADDLPNPVSMPAGEHGADPEVPEIGGGHSLEEIEKAHLIEVLRSVPSLHEAASVLGIDKATLYRKRKRFGID